jgi:hypothetical protein
VQEERRQELRRSPVRLGEIDAEGDRGAGLGEPVDERSDDGSRPRPLPDLGEALSSMSTIATGDFVGKRGSKRG